MDALTTLHLVTILVGNEGNKGLFDIICIILQILFLMPTTHNKGTIIEGITQEKVSYLS